MILEVVAVVISIVGSGGNFSKKDSPGWRGGAGNMRPYNPKEDGGLTSFLGEGGNWGGSTSRFSDRPDNQHNRSQDE